MRVESGLDRDLIQLVFDTYRCIPGIRHEPGYEGFKTTLVGSGCSTEDEMNRWREAAVVEKLGTDGE